MSQAKANNQNIYDIVTVMDVRIRNLHPGPGKGHVKIMLIPVIALSFPHFCPKLERTLHIHQEQHSWHAGNILFWKQCIEIPKYAILWVRVVSDQLFNVNGPRAQAQRDELVTRLSFGETVEFLQAEEFVSRETLVQSPETLL